MWFMLCLQFLRSFNLRSGTLRLHRPHTLGQLPEVGDWHTAHTDRLQPLHLHWPATEQQKGQVCSSLGAADFQTCAF